MLTATWWPVILVTATYLRQRRCASGHTLPATLSRDANCECSEFLISRTPSTKPRTRRRARAGGGWRRKALQRLSAMDITSTHPSTHSASQAALLRLRKGLRIREQQSLGMSPHSRERFAFSAALRQILLESKSPDSLQQEREELLSSSRPPEPSTRHSRSLLTTS